MEEPGDEEKQFVTRMIATGSPELAARGTLVPMDASQALAKRTAMQALGDTAVKAYFIDLMEEVELTPQDMMKTLKRNLKTKKYALHQESGRKVQIGDDGMTQLTAAKLIMQAMGVLGGGVKAETTDQKAVPAQTNIYFPVTNINVEKKEDVVIDGNGRYSVSD